MKRSLLLAAIVSGLVWMGSAAFGAFQREEAKQDLLISVLRGIYQGGKSPFVKEPEYKGKPAYGGMKLAGKPIPLVVFAKKEKGDPDTLILDLNGNKDITDDPVISRPKAGESVAVPLPIGKEKPIKARIQIQPMPGGRGQDPIVMLLLTPGEWFRGTVDVGGRKVNAVLVDRGWDGLKEDLRSEDCLLLDLDGDGVFAADPGKYQFDGFIPLQPLVCVAGDVYDLKLDAQAPDVTLKRYEGACGYLALDLRIGPEWKNARLMANVLSGTDDPKNMKAFETTSEKNSSPIRLPVGSYQSAMMMLSLMENGKSKGVLLFRPAGGKLIQIEEGKTFTLTAAKPEKMEVTVTQNGNQLRIGKTLSATGNVEWGMFMQAGPDGEMKQMDAPSVEVFAAGAPKDAPPILKGAMRYG
jgi:hypothetical protein